MPDKTPLPRSWPALAEAAGFGAEVTDVLALPERSGRRAWRLFRAAGDVTVVEGEALGDWAAAQRMAWLRLGGDAARLRLPRVLAVAPDGGAVLMAAPGGPTAAERIEVAESHADRRAVLTAAGGWLSAFHRSGKTPVRPYQTRFVTDALSERRARLHQTGAAEAQFLDRLMGEVLASADSHNGQPARHGPRHGDMVLDHLVLSPDGGGDMIVTGTGPLGIGSAPVGHDLARFLVDYVTRYGDHRATQAGELLARADRVAFFKGYDLTGPEDGALGFLAGVQLVNDWLALPRGPDLPLDQMVRLAGLRETAVRLYPALAEG